MSSHVVFVCVGNRIRSVFAEFFVRDMFDNRYDDIALSSAGFVPQALKDRLAALNIQSPEPFYNRAMSELTMKALLEKGIGVPEGWRSKELNLAMIKEADLIITALPAQKEDISGLYRESRNKIFTIRELSERDEYLFFEDLSVIPFNDTFWDYCEEDPEYVSKIHRSWEETLTKAIPSIIKKLGIREMEKND